MFQNNWKVNIKKSVNSKELLQSDLWDERGAGGRRLLWKSKYIKSVVEKGEIDSR